MLNIAILDDHPIVAHGLEAESEHDFPVRVLWHASTVEAAIEQIRRRDPETPDVIISDLRIPGEEARDFWKHCGRIPFVVYSAYYFDEEVLAAHRAGARAYLTKDLPLKEVRRILYEVLDGRRVISAKDRQVFRQDRFMGVSPREREVLQLLFEGHSYSEIATRLEISLQSVKTYQQNVYRKLDAGSRGEAVYRAIARGLLAIPEFGVS